MAVEKRRVFSIGSWSPALRTMLASETGACGCLVGVYQVWAGAPLAVVDLAHAQCPHRHRQGDIVEHVSATTPAEHA